MKRMSEHLVELIFYIIIFIAALPVYYLIGNAECNAKAKSFEHNFGVIQGCMIKNKSGFWIPLENYRDVSP